MEKRWPQQLRDSVDNWGVCCVLKRSSSPHAHSLASVVLYVQRLSDIAHPAALGSRVRLLLVTRWQIEARVLIREWDRGGDGLLSMHEFRVSVRKMGIHAEVGSREARGWRSLALAQAAGASRPCMHTLSFGRWLLWTISFGQWMLMVEAM